MTNVSKYLVVIPARGGSKGVPGKNIKKLNGKPLINYTIEAARELFNDQEIYVSTDSSDIKRVAENIGLDVPFLRPSSLATDISDTRDVLLHSLDYYKSTYGYEPEGVILLQPTSPFRTSKHISEALSLWKASPDLDMVVSVKETKANPYYVLFEENQEGFLEKSKEGLFTRRQDCPKVFEFNGSIYIISTKSLRSKQISEFKKSKRYLMDEFSSHDIDSPFDWLIASNMIKKTIK
jgi:CMP-N,N'-diacetyllegionaminic acid synthase